MSRRTIAHVIPKLVAASVAAVLLVGCAPSQDSSATTSSVIPSVTTTSTATPAAGAVSLAGLGLEHGPAGFLLPEGITVVDQVDHVNNVTLLLEPDDAPVVLAFLRTHLHGSGFRITADGNGSMTFVSDRADTAGWSGALASSQNLTGLTLRTR